MKKSSKQTLAKRGVWVGRAQNAAGTQVHADKRRLARPAEKQRLKRELQQETARQRGPFRCLWLRLLQMLSFNKLRKRSYDLHIVLGELTEPEA